MPLCVNAQIKTSPPSIAKITTINIIPSQPMLPLHPLYKHLFHLESILTHF